MSLCLKPIRRSLFHENRASPHICSLLALHYRQILQEHSGSASPVSEKFRHILSWILSCHQPWFLVLQPHFQVYLISAPHEQISPLLDFLRLIFKQTSLLPTPCLPDAECPSSASRRISPPPHATFARAPRCAFGWRTIFATRAITTDFSKGAPRRYLSHFPCLSGEIPPAWWESRSVRQLLHHNTITETSFPLHAERDIFFPICRYRTYKDGASSYRQRIQMIWSRPPGFILSRCRRDASEHARDAYYRGFVLLWRHTSEVAPASASAAFPSISHAVPPARA